MLHPSYKELKEKIRQDADTEAGEVVVNSRYAIVCATAKRARQIVDGKEPMVKMAKNDKALSVAVKELYNGDLKVINNEEE